ncbi:PPE family protein [Mycobacterium shigaense]|uniref:PPE family protein n=1 Tax=Mycobacterium shigaense TaxID=722731 RepID=UPI002ADF5AD2|nr:PPE family protein [Mycobacterium shigaense]MEA1120951.1 PPE family protein [Mycobacterium shigaense]
MNSGKMHAGPGSASMLRAAAAWTELAAELRSHAAPYGSAVSVLTSQSWRGAASLAMADAAAPYVVWMNMTAMQAEQTAEQATAAASAFETAFAMTVPPAAIAINRTALASLVASNTFGQNASAIAATEAHYGEMWAQDAAAMYGYAGQSAAATKVPSFSTAPQTTNSGGQNEQVAAVTQAASSSATTETQATLSQAAPSITSTLQNLSSPAAATSSNSSSILDPNANFWNTLTSTGALNPSQIVTASTLGTNGASSIVGDGALDSFATLASSYGAGAQEISGPATSVTAGLGQATSIGHLSAPSDWAATAPPAAPLSPALATIPIGAQAQAASGMPGIAPATLAEHATLRAVLPDNRFLARPPMVPRWPSTG